MSDNSLIGFISFLLILFCVIFVSSFHLSQSAGNRPIGSVLLQTHSAGGITSYDSKKECEEALVKTLQDEATLTQEQQKQDNLHVDCI